MAFHKSRKMKRADRLKASMAVEIDFIKRRRKSQEWRQANGITVDPHENFAAPMPIHGGSHEQDNR